MKRYQGEDIPFHLRMNYKGIGFLKTFREAVRVMIYFYTNEQYIAKYGIEFDGNYEGSEWQDDYYTPLHINESGKILSGTLTTEHTRVMRGTLYADVIVTLDYENTDKIKRINTGVEICHASIKIEAND